MVWFKTLLQQSCCDGPHMTLVLLFPGVWLVSCCSVLRNHEELGWSFLLCQRSTEGPGALGLILLLLQSTCPRVMSFPGVRVVPSAKQN